MKKYAVVRIQGKQYKVSVGEEILIDKLVAKSVEPEVLLLVDGDKLQLGKPNLKDVKIKIKILEAEVKGEKVDVFKYKSKSRYRKHTGFRPKYTKLLVEQIN